MISIASFTSLSRSKKVIPPIVYNVITSAIDLIYFPFYSNDYFASTMRDYSTNPSNTNSTTPGAITISSISSAPSGLTGRNKMTCGSNAYATVTSPITTTGTNYTGLSFSFWLYVNNNGNTGQFHFALNSSSIDTNGLLFGTYGGNVKTVINGSNILNMTPVSTSTWYHFVWNITSSSQTLYKNGTSVGSSSNSVTINATRVGRVGTSYYPDPSTGDLADFRIYNRVLTPSEITQLYNDSTLIL